MDTSAILWPLFSQLWFVPLFLILAGVLTSPWLKGWLGEVSVNRALKTLPEFDYHLHKNVTLPTEDGSTQVDHILVSRFGVFVIETKNMQGWIFGKEHQKVWTQKIFKKSIKFQNPLHQNYKHTKTLENLLGLTDAEMHSIVVFTGNSEFKTEMPDNVLTLGQLVAYIRSFATPLFDGAELTEIGTQISQRRFTPGIRTHIKHVQHVKQLHPTKLETHDCPQCGPPMKIRVSKRGAYVGQKFWGCSRFPDCKTVIKIYDDVKKTGS